MTKNFIKALDIPEDDEIYQYSDPQKVWDNGREWGVNVFRSNKRNKKYMWYDGNKWVHFGEMGYEDYTKHKNENRREAFLKRNKRWEQSAPGTPAFMSYYLLW